MTVSVKLFAAAAMAAFLAACASTPPPVQTIQAPPAAEVDAKTALENGQ
jgi:ABC-type uncharacterized transport system auxiliary subunit